jgi:hypothetical protein
MRSCGRSRGEISRWQPLGTKIGARHWAANSSMSFSFVWIAFESNPESYPLVDAEVHRALLRRFPYAIYYTIETSHIQILGVLHCHQHPDSWRTRA